MSSTTTVPVAPERPEPPPAPVSFEAFLAWADEDTLAEWVDGEIVMMSPASADHQRLLAFLHGVMNAYIERHQLGEVLFAPFLMRLAARPSGREPDLLFVAREHLDRLQPTYLDGPADLVVEIVSPDSISRDRGDKFAEYEQAGIPEYWLIDPLRQEASFYQLGDDGHYRRGMIDADGVYRSLVLPGFWLRVDWLWQHPLPSVAEVTRLIGV
jgi:Uma2 family endonuclease